MQPFVLALLLLFWLVLPAPVPSRPAQPATAGAAQAAALPYGLQFDCAVEGVDSYFDALGIDSKLIVKTRDGHGVRYALAGAEDGGDTLDFAIRPELGLRDDIVLLPDRDKPRAVATVSKKEIALALMQRGRLTRFAGPACSVQALADHIGIRQNIVAWAERLDWTFPDGRHATWNRKYWRNGTPRRDVPLHVAVNDAFVNQDKYRVGCYAATKLIVLQGVLDYYAHVRPDAAALRRVETRLWSDGEPLAAVEPAAMWSFEADFDQSQRERPGKLVDLQQGVASRNFVPGDWAYFLNTDPVSNQRSGYEGSSTVYLGRGRFSDTYNDNHHAFTWREKLDEVYQWKNGVFAIPRHLARKKPLTEAELQRLAATPQAGGLLLDLRAAPYLHFPAEG